MKQGWNIALVVAVFALSFAPGRNAQAWQGASRTPGKTFAVGADPQAPLRVADLWDWVKRNLESESSDATKPSAGAGGEAGQAGSRDDAVDNAPNYPQYPGQHTVGVGGDGGGGDSGDSGGH
jgi:hypothetical protein